MKIMMAGQVTHEIKVTRLGKGWGVRCFTNDTLNQEIRVQCLEDIGVASADMFRTEVKCGNISEQATKTRDRFYKGDSFRAYNKPSIAVKI